MKLTIVILAAGEGRRMHSDIPKTLHKIGGIPIIEHIIATAKKLNPEQIMVVYGNHCEAMKTHLSHLPIKWVKQEKQLGTGHAVLQAVKKIPQAHNVLVLCGDVPLIKIETLKKLIKKTAENTIGWITAIMQNPFGMGRIIRDGNKNAIAIIEEKDAKESQKNINEINTGICLIPAKILKTELPRLKNKNAQGEYYLTDVFGLAVTGGIKITTVFAEKEYEIIGVNNLSQLALLERIYQRNLANEYMLKGLTLLDPNRFDVRGKLIFGRDVVIDINVIIEGTVKIGKNCYIAPNVILRDVTMGDNVRIDENTVIQNTVIGDWCKIGPFARLRPGTKLGKAVKIGNFVETKKAIINDHSKVNHLSYMGDAKIGKRVNVGAGSITCNYDGIHKHTTEIGDDAFIGSDTKMVAPIKIGARSTIGAGSTITEDTPKGKLTLARTKQITIKHWQDPKAKKK